jgi:hypothetical protein
MKLAARYIISSLALLGLILSATLYTTQVAQALGNQDPLQQRRSEDQQQCEEEQQVGGGLGSALQNPNSLESIVSKGITEKLGDTLGKVFTDKVPQMIQAQLEARLPQMIQDGLGRQLPNLIQGRVGDLVAQGGTDASIRGALPGIIAELLQQLIPQIIGQGLPGLLQEGLQQQLPPEITVRIQAQLPGILNNSTLPANIRRLVNDQTTGLPSQVEINDTDRQHAADQITTDVTHVAQGAIAESNATQELSRQMTALILERLLPIIQAQLVPHISQSVSSFTSGGGAQTIGGLINRIPGTGGNLIQSLNIESGILQPMSNEIAHSLSESVGTSIREFQIDNVLQDAPFLSDGELAQQLGDIRGVNAYVDGAGNFVGYSYLGDTFGQDVGSAVNGASGQIANNATGGFNFDRLGASVGNSLKAGLASGISGGLGGLVAGIPYAGPLLAPIVQEVTQQALNQLLNIGGGGGIGILGRAEAGATASKAGLLFGNLGLGDVGAANVQATTFGFFTSNMNTGQISSNTKTSNTNEQHIIDLETRIKTLEKQACTYTKIVKRITLSMEEKEFVLDPNARKAAFLSFQNYHTNFFKKFLKTGFQVSPGTTNTQPSGGGTEGSALFSENRTQDVSDAEKEAAAVSGYVTQQSGNIHKDVVVNTLTKTNATTYTESIKSTITKAEYDQLKNNPKSLTDSRYNDLKLETAEPRNNEYGSYLLAFAKQESDKAEAAEETKATLAANGGYKPVRYCDPKDMVRVPMGGLYCAHWQTLVPGSSVKNYADKLRTGFIDFLIGTRENVEDFVVKALQTPSNDPERALMGLDEVVAAPGTGGALSSNSDTCPSPGPCQNSGWQPQQAASVSSAFNNPGRPAGNTGPDFFGQAFERGLTAGLGGLINQGFNLGQSEISRLTSSLNSGFSTSGITGQENPLQLQFIVRGIIENVVHNSPDVISEDQERLIDFLVILITSLIGAR